MREMRYLDSWILIETPVMILWKRTATMLINKCFIYYLTRIWMSLRTRKHHLPQRSKFSIISSFKKEITSWKFQACHTFMNFLCNLLLKCFQKVKWAKLDNTLQLKPTKNFSTGIPKRRNGNKLKPKYLDLHVI